MEDFYKRTVKYQFSENLDVDSDFVDHLSGEEGIKYKAYLDSIGKPTIGIGFTAGVKMGDTMTPQQVEERLKKEIAIYEAVVDKYVEVPLTQYQFNALVSFVYNLGENNFRTSALLRLLNEGDYEGCAEQFTRFVFAGGKDCRKKESNCYGIVTRREREKAMFQGKDWRLVK